MIAEFKKMRKSFNGRQPPISIILGHKLAEMLKIDKLVMLNLGQHSISFDTKKLAPRQTASLMF